MSERSNHEKRKIMFWGAQCNSLWIKDFIFHNFERLTSIGWHTTYYFTAINEYNLGYDARKDYTPDWVADGASFNPDVVLLNNMPMSLYYTNSPESVATYLQQRLPADPPNIILTRVSGRDYLSKIYPNVPILTMSDVFNWPWLSGLAFCFRTDDDNCGVPVLSRFSDVILDNTVLPDDLVDSVQQLNTANDLTDDDRRKIRQLIETLRSQYSTIAILPMDLDRGDVRYLEFAAQDEPFQTKNDLLNYLLENTSEETCFLVTSHPSETDIYHFITNERIISADTPIPFLAHQTMSQILGDLCRTEYLLPFADKLVVRNSKAIWHALLNNKPILSLGRHDIAFANPYHDIGDWLQAEDNTCSEITVATYLYWMITRLRIDNDETEKLARILERAVEKRNPTTEDLLHILDWGTDEEYFECFNHALQKKDNPV